MQAEYINSSVSGPAKLAFVFAGQGAQWPQMGLDLMVYPVFSNIIKKAGTYLKNLGVEWSLIGEFCETLP
jgi:malonyl CoA-acyl carrier protein transacylase